MLESVLLTKQYEDGQVALNALNLNVKPGEIFFLLGANGAGKTTAIHLFLNFIVPTQGHVFINKMDVVANPLETKKHLSFLSENVMLYGNFTARQNLDFFAKLGGKTGLPKKECYAFLHKVGLQDEAFEKKLKTFSKGMRQKVGLAIVLAKDADNILLDEPSSGLDPQAAAELVAILKEQRNAGKAILMCTHDIFRAKEMADHVGIMKQGRMVRQLTRKEFLSEDLEKLYLDYMAGSIE
ncbi:MAG: ABC transporter ATP-binding protein [Tannerella sp.]|jgi:ABC-2 type transport system ATP-binding protein|nr:ABC transporter ATP-binding protein [Tannerella sp.]